MKAIVFMLAAAGCFCHNMALAQQTKDETTGSATRPMSRSDRKFQEELARKNPTYSEAVLMNRDPREYLIEKESKMSQPGIGDGGRDGRRLCGQGRLGSR